MAKRKALTPSVENPGKKIIPFIEVQDPDYGVGNYILRLKMTLLPGNHQEEYKKEVVVKEIHIREIVLMTKMGPKTKVWVRAAPRN